MFSKIMVPVDLAHASSLAKALKVAGTLAGTYDAEVCYVGVTTSAPSSAARTPDEFASKLEGFAAGEGKSHGVKTSSRMIVSHDPSVQMNRELESEVADFGADLVVMATHVPGAADYVWSGHGAHLAAHSEVSVLLVRG